MLLPRTARFFVSLAIGIALFLCAAWLAEKWGVAPRVIGLCFLVATIALYAGIGVAMRTQDVVEYYVAGRRIPGIANGMATAADWMSAASFIGLAGAIYHQGFEGLAYLTGWTGGFVLVALFFGPYLRKFGQFTVPELVGERYGPTAEWLAVCAVVLASFVYLVAQIYAVGLVASRFASVPFEIGLFVGLAGILVCSFLGGMRGVTWTQVSQYLILIVAYVAPLVVLSQQRFDLPIPHFAMPQLAQAERAIEERVTFEPAEIAVRAQFQAEADHYRQLLAAWPQSVEPERLRLWERWQIAREAGERPESLRAMEDELRALTKGADSARAFWIARLADAERAALPLRPFFAAWSGQSEAEKDEKRRNFLALMFVLMVGTAALPHILMRYYTTSTVEEARTSTAWTLFFVAILYLCAPLYALFARVELGQWFGTSIEAASHWLANWTNLGLATFTDRNGDGLIQSAELRLSPDAVVLALPELSALPYTIAGLVAAGALASALSTADGLLLTISNALGHDIYYKRLMKAQSSTHRRLLVNKTLLLLTAVFAAWVAALRLDTILLLVGLSFSLAAATLFPTVLLGIFWRRATRVGAVVAMVGGFAVSVLYYVLNHPVFGFAGDTRIWGIDPVACGVFGVLFGFGAHAVVGAFGWGARASDAVFVARMQQPE
ncbi:VC_2705 family sodium/solute symporter [Hydrogenophilus thermoluteolus]|nr:VC_2705 family sodium/solute symporter [Hydrogenophilus thermoluteolus]MBW7656056.1 VC_2705 family sodium/solute symporter [Hydrogenophilus thermoluteolus]